MEAHREKAKQKNERMKKRGHEKRNQKCIGRDKQERERSKKRGDEKGKKWKCRGREASKKRKE